MEAKKSIKLIACLTIGAIVIFLSVLLLNNRSGSKDADQKAADSLYGTAPENQQSFSVANLPVRTEEDFFTGPGDEAADIIVYEDYADSYSADFADILNQAKNEFGDKINLVYRPFNVASASLSDTAALAVRCAADQNQGEPYRAKVFEAFKAGQLSQDKLTVLAVATGVNKEDFASCLTNSEKRKKIEESMANAENFSVTGAPTVFVGDEMIVGARPYETFTDSNNDEIEGLKQVIARQLK